MIKYCNNAILNRTDANEKIYLKAFGKLKQNLLIFPKFIYNMQLRKFNCFT